MLVVPPAGYRPRISFVWALSMAAVFVVLALWFVTAIIREGEQTGRRNAARLARWDGAELVRICAGGERVFRLNGRLVVAHPWNGDPVQFAAAVTPEAACAR